MSKTALIIQREFVTRVRKKSFIVMTILSPFLFAALTLTPALLGAIKGDDTRHVGVYDATGKYVSAFTGGADFTYEPVADCNAPELYSDTSEVEAVVAISADPAVTPHAVTIYSRREVPADLLAQVHDKLTERVREERLAASGVAGLDTLIAKVQAGVDVATVKRSEGGDRASSTTAAIAAGFVFTALIYMFMSAYGTMVMQSVTEEKTNRIVEIIVSSVKPFQLMMGKIVGIALVGFLQVAIWALMFGVILSATGLIIAAFNAPADMAAAGAMAANGAADAGSLAAMLPEGEGRDFFMALSGLPLAELTVVFVLYFVGGYFLYASFFAAAGASVSEAEDSSQFVLPIILVLLFAFYAAIGSVDNPDGPLAFWASMFPLTSPVVMMVRVPFGVPLWQEALSLALLFATALLFIWLGGRIYRMGILMYGKKPSFRQIGRWIKAK